MDSSRIVGGCIMAPVDFTDVPVRDVRAAAAIARVLGVPLLLVHVVPPLQGLERLRVYLDTHNRVQLERAGEQIQLTLGHCGYATDGASGSM